MPRVRADIVAVAPRGILGLVSEVLVKDNDIVKKGDVLFKVDEKRFQIAEEQAEAQLQGPRRG